MSLFHKEEKSSHKEFLSFLLQKDVSFATFYTYLIIQCIDVAADCDCSKFQVKFSGPAVSAI